MLQSIASRRLNSTCQGSLLRALARSASSEISNPSVKTPLFFQSKPEWKFVSQDASHTTPQQQQRRWMSETTTKPTPEETENEEDVPPKDVDDSEEEENPSEKLQEEIKELKDQLLRSLAEQENIRAIARRDVESARNFSVKSFAKSLLEVADNLDRALETVDPDQVSKNDTLKTFVEGIEMTGTGLVKALKSNGVEAFCEAPGDEFDAEKHQALMEYADPKGTPGTVGVVMKKGYTLNGRVLRAAEVGVIKKE